MSELYDGIAFLGNRASAEKAFQTISAACPITLYQFTETFFAVSFDYSRNDTTDKENLFGAAKAVSNECGRALAVLYDNRVGYRASFLFREALLMANFAEEHETWVALLNTGLPDLLAEPVPANLLHSELEYECLHDAITLGLIALGAPGNVKAETLKAAFCYGKARAIGKRA